MAMDFGSSIGDFLLSWFGTPFAPLKSSSSPLTNIVLPLLYSQKKPTETNSTIIEEALSHVNTLDALNLYEDVKRGIEFNPRRIGHILLDSSAGLGEATGSFRPEAIEWLIENLQDSSEPLRDFIPSFGDLRFREQEWQSGLDRISDHIRAIKTLKPGQSFFLPGGYVEHYMFYEWIKETDDPATYTMNVYNSNPSNIIQKLVIVNDKLMMSACVSYKHIPEAALFSDKGAENDMIQLLNHIISGKDEHPIYNDYLAHLKPYYAPGGVDLVTPQRSGTCGFSALVACLRHHLPLASYKSFMLEMKMKEFVAAYNLIKSELETPLEETSSKRHLLQQAAQALIHRLEKELCKPEESHFLPKNILASCLYKVLYIKRALDRSEKSAVSTLSLDDLVDKIGNKFVLPSHFTVEDSSSHHQLKPFTQFLYCRSHDPEKADMIIIPKRDFKKESYLAPELSFTDDPPPYEYYSYPVDPLTGNLKIEECSQSSALYLTTVFLHSHNHYEEALALIPEKIEAPSAEIKEQINKLAQLSSYNRNMDPRAAAVVLKACLSINIPLPGDALITYFIGQYSLPSSFKISPEKLLLPLLLGYKTSSYVTTWIVHLQKQIEDKVAKLPQGSAKDELLHLLITSYLKDERKNLHKAARSVVLLSEETEESQKKKYVLQLKIAALLFEKARYAEAFDLIPDVSKLSPTHRNSLNIFLQPFFSPLIPQEALAIQLKIISGLNLIPQKDLIVQYLFTLKNLPPHMKLPPKTILPYLEIYHTHPTVAAHIEDFKKAAEAI